MIRWRVPRVRQQLLLIGTLAATVVGLLALAPVMLSGVTGRYYDNPQWSGEPALTVRDSEPDLSRVEDGGPGSRYSIEWTGALYIPGNDEYRFTLTSDDGSQLWVGDDLIVDNGGTHGSRTVDGDVRLPAGFHPIRIRYMQQEGEATFDATWRRALPDGAVEPDAEPLSTALLFPAAPGPATFAVVRIGRGIAATLPPWLIGLLALSLLGWRVWVCGRRQVGDLASSVVEIALLATLGIVFWIALSGGVTLPTGMVVLSARSYEPLLFIVAGLLVFRYWLRGTALGGLRFPPSVTDSVTRAWGRLVNGYQRSAASPARRTRLIVTMVLAAGLLVGIGLSGHVQQGLTGRYYDEWNWSGALLGTARDRTLTLRRPVYDFINPDYTYSVEWTGVIHIPSAGAYRFLLRTDEGAGLWIDDVLVVSHRISGDVVNVQGVVRLRPGFHPIRIRYTQPRGRMGMFAAEWRRDSFARDTDQPPLRELSSALLFPDVPSASAFAVVRLGQWLMAIGRLLLLAGLTAICLVGSHWVLGALRLRSLRPRVGEPHVYLATLAGLATLYLMAAFGDLQGYWGFDALGPLGRDRTLVGFLLAVLAMMAYQRHRPRADALVMTVQTYLYARPIVVVAAAVLGVFVFFGLRNEYLNSDGVALRWAIPQIAESGKVEFDEMWESYLHARFWSATNGAFNWSVRLSYQVASSIAGGAFILVLWSYARRLLPGASLPFFLLMACGGYMQLFFGDVENYTMVTVLIVAYFLVSARFLQEQHSVVAPTAALALAMSFHMLAAFLLPSLGVLYLVELRRRRFLQIGLGMAVFVTIILGTVALLGGPLESLYQGSHGTSAIRELLSAGRGALASDGQAVEMGRWVAPALDAYHWDQYNLLALMFPAHLLLIPLVLGGRIRLDWINVHLIVASLGMAILQFGYLSMLGAYGDWNLNANAAIPPTILVWRNLLGAPQLRYKGAIVIGWACLSFMHTYAWIVSNHSAIP